MMLAGLSPPIRRFAAVGLALILLLGVGSLVVVPVIAHVQALDDSIEAKRLEVMRFQRLVAAASGGEVAGQSPSEQASYLPGETEAIQQAALQTELKRMAADAGVRVLSTSAISVPPRHGFHVAATQMTLRAPVSAVYDLLRKIEAHDPPTLVDLIGIHPVQGPQPQAGGRVLEVEIRVLGLLRREVGKS